MMVLPALNLPVASRRDARRVPGRDLVSSASIGRRLSDIARTRGEQPPQAQRLGQVQRDEVRREADHERNRPQRQQPAASPRHTRRKTPSLPRTPQSSSRSARSGVVPERPVGHLPGRRPRPAAAPTIPASTVAIPSPDRLRASGAPASDHDAPPDHPASPGVIAARPSSPARRTRPRSRAAARQQEPWRRTAPGVDRVADPAEQHNRADQRVARRGRRARPADILLKIPQGTCEELAAIVLRHCAPAGPLFSLSPPVSQATADACEAAHDTRAQPVVSPPRSRSWRGRAGAV